MRKILLTARRWDLIFDVLRSLRRSKDHQKHDRKKRKREKEEKKEQHTHTKFLSPHY